MSKKVMIVDDAQFMRQILRKHITAHGYSVVAEATDGDEAVEIYKEIRMTEDKPDLIIMDITMKKMNGIEALKAIKEIDEDALVMMCSAMGTKDNTYSAVTAGAAAFLKKPFEKEVVLEKIDKLLK